MRDAETVLDNMKREALWMIEKSHSEEVRKAWYYSHLGSIDFARLYGLITEPRRQRLYKEFKKEVRMWNRIRTGGNTW